MTASEAIVGSMIMLAIGSLDWQEIVAIVVAVLVVIELVNGLGKR